MINLASSGSRLFGEVFPWLLVLAVVVVVGGVLVYAVRRLITDQPSQSREGFTLHDLRELHRAGELSDDEYERAKENMIGRVAETQEGEDSEPQAGHDGGKSN